MTSLAHLLPVHLFHQKRRIPTFVLHNANCSCRATIIEVCCVQFLMLGLLSAIIIFVMWLAKPLLLHAWNLRERIYPRSGCLCSYSCFPLFVYHFCCCLCSVPPELLFFFFFFSFFLGGGGDKSCERKEVAHVYRQKSVLSSYCKKNSRKLPAWVKFDTVLLPCRLPHAAITTNLICWPKSRLGNHSCQLVSFSSVFFFFFYYFPSRCQYFSDVSVSL